MSDDRPGEPCEGGCGCRLDVQTGRKPREILDEPGGPRWEQHSLGDDHTARRCQVIRTLRTAGEDAAGPDGYAVVAVWPVGPAICAFDAHGRWARAPLAWELVLRVDPVVLNSIAGKLSQQLRRMLQSDTTTGSATAMPVLARSPARWSPDTEETP